MTVKQRDVSLDFLKGLAVVFMVTQHISLWLWERGCSAGWSVFKEAPVLNTVIAFSALSAPIFIFSAGYGAFLFMKYYRDDAKIIRRGLVLIVLGYFMVWTIDAWFSPASWYVLQCIGLCFLTVPLIRKFNNRQRITASAVIALISAFGQYFLQTPLVYGNTRMADTALAFAPLRFALFEGHFPFFPWGAVFVYGYVTGAWVKSGNRRFLFDSSVILIASGFVLMSVGAVFPALKEWGVLKYILSYRVRFYPLLFPVLFVLAGAASLSLCICFLLCKCFGVTRNNLAAAVGRFSLTAFFSHLYIKEFVYTFDCVRVFNKWHTILIILFLLGFYAVISILWEKKGYIFSLEWVLRKLG